MKTEEQVQAMHDRTTKVLERAIELAKRVESNHLDLITTSSSNTIRVLVDIACTIQGIKQSMRWYRPPIAWVLDDPSLFSAKEEGCSLDEFMDEVELQLSKDEEALENLLRDVASLKEGLQAGNK